MLSFKSSVPVGESVPVQLHVEVDGAHDEGTGDHDHHLQDRGLGAAQPVEHRALRHVPKL